ncbi:putative quinol monooxygenase [Sphingomonas abietis]|uniref:Quinol monooxygenase n=1 Tax=Sphingomonas abietis TaxID=3012344 RepID=A0ABY7NKP3_9SPHN|nr:putative quinol monooxygenase [Sphingomonas abietis]WBO22073.1 putative quinol monooxygenase [Sphingomonas abietis]
MPIKVVALISVKPGSEAGFESAAAAVAAEARQEPGNHHYNVWREASGDRRYVFDELYADQAAVDAHMASDHFRAFAKAIGDLLTAPPLIVPAPEAVDVA